MKRRIKRTKEHVEEANAPDAPDNDAAAAAKTSAAGTQFTCVTSKYCCCCCCCCSSHSSGRNVSDFHYLTKSLPPLTKPLSAAAAAPTAVDEMQAISIFSASSKLRGAGAVVLKAPSSDKPERLRVLCALTNNALEVLFLQ